MVSLFVIGLFFKIGFVSLCLKQRRYWLLTINTVLTVASLLFVPVDFFYYPPGLPPGFDSTRYEFLWNYCGGVIDWQSIAVQVILVDFICTLIIIGKMVVDVLRLKR